MKRLAILIGTMLSVALIGFTATTWLPDTPDTTAQEDRTINVTLSYATNVAFADEGDTCYFIARSDVASSRGHIVVRDGSGTIIAMSASPTGEQMSVEGEGELDLECRADLTVSAPTTEFYEIYWGNTWIASMSASDFPMDEPIRISLD